MLRVVCSWLLVIWLPMFDGEPVDTSSHLIKIKRHSVELLLIWSRGGWRDQASRRVAIGLPSQSGRDAYERHD
jgi:hypothetical protein